MVKKLFISAIFLFVSVSFASVEVLEKSDGRIVARVRFEPLAHEKGAAFPVVSLPFTAQRGSRPQVSAQAQNRFTLKIDEKLESRNVSPHVVSFSAREVPVFSAQVSPVLSINGDEIVYSTEILVTISYFAPNTRNFVPRSDFYRTLSAKLLNPDRMENTVSSLSIARASRRTREINNIPTGRALRFQIGDRPSANDYDEADLSKKAGIYRIVPADLAPLGSQIPMHEIKIRSSNPNVADSVTPSAQKLVNELAGLADVHFIPLDKNGNGIFDGTDEILFYAEKIHAWIFDEERNDWRFLFNFTDYRRYYWITRDGAGDAQMRKFTSAPQTGQPQTFADVYFHAKRTGRQTTPKTSFDPHGDKRWAWTSFTPNNRSLSVEFPSSFNGLPDAHAQDEAFIRFRAHHIRGNNNNLTFSTQHATATATLNAATWTPFRRAAQFSVSVPNISSGYVDFDSYDLRYRQKLSMSNRANLQFYSPVRTGETQTPVSYLISDLPAEFRVLVRHNPKTQNVQLIDLDSSAGTFSFTDMAGGGYKYHLATRSGFLSIGQTETVEIERDSPFRAVNLQNTSNRSDYLIITSSDLLSQATELAMHKTSTGQFASPKVVVTDDIFRIFSGGVYSPEAIRNFMVYAQNFWDAAPEYLVLFGDGHYDYKGISYAQKNRVPVYISSAWQYGRDLIAYPIDDFFAYTEAGAVAGETGLRIHADSTQSQNDSPGSQIAFPQLFVGRIPVNDALEANNYLQKLKDLETAAGDFSSWRNRYLFIGDDDIVQSLRVADLETSRNMAHTLQSDILANVIAEADRTADIRKVTLFEFPVDNQLRKPLARSAIINEINNGVSLVSYVGHGSTNTLSDQRVFMSQDISLLTNNRRYFIFLALSCSVGHFDDPTSSGMSQLLLRAQRHGLPTGAIISVSSSRASWPAQNTAFGRELIKNLFDPSESFSAGQSYIDAKFRQNIPTYSLLGDPSYVHMRGRKNIDPIEILKEDGTPLSRNDTLKKMQTVLLRGKLPIGDDATARRAEVFLQNPENMSPSRKDGVAHHWDYRLPGMITARQSVNFTGNTFELPFTVPPTVLEDSSGSAFRIHVNSQTDTDIFTGVKDDGLIFGGFDVSNIDTTDKSGPVIVVQRFFADSAGNIDETANDAVGNKIKIDGFNRRSQTATLNVRVSDKSGVDIFSAAAPGGGVSVAIDRAMNVRQFGREDLTLVNDDFREVLLPLTLSRSDFAATGEYELTVSARDILQNVCTKRYILDVKSFEDEQYTIGDFFCYPSPVRMGRTTQFFFNQPLDNVADISLKIYTLNGRLVRSFSNVRRGVTWDLTDQRGQKLSPNVYLYRLFVKRYVRDDGSAAAAQGKTKTEIIKSKTKKLVIHPPR